jgi:excisionase family DNA binding protein
LLIYGASEEVAAMDEGDRLLTPGEVGALFRVDPKTVTRWAHAGRIGSIRTPGGHRRFRESEVRALLEGRNATGIDALIINVLRDRGTKSAVAAAASREARPGSPGPGGAAGQRSG